MLTTGETKVSIQLVSLASREKTFCNGQPLSQKVSIQLVSLASREQIKGAWNSFVDFLVSIQLVSLASREA